MNTLRWDHSLRCLVRVSPRLNFELTTIQLPTLMMKFEMKIMTPDGLVTYHRVENFTGYTGYDIHFLTWGIAEAKSAFYGSVLTFYLNYPNS